MAVSTTEMQARRELAESTAARVDAAYVRHHARVYALALNFGGGSHAWAEDVTQDVFYRLLETIDSLPDRGDLGPWLRRVTVNRCISLQRKRAVRSSPYVRWLLREPTVEDEPEERLDVSADLRRVWDALEGLPAKQRAVFSLRHLQGVAQTEIATTLGHSEGYVSKLLGRAERHVRARVRRAEEAGDA